MVDKQASDLYLRIRAIPRARINGKVELISDTAISKEEMLAVTNLLLGNEQRREKFHQNMDIDFIHEEIGVGRFRINIFIQRGTAALVARHVQSYIRTF